MAKQPRRVRPRTSPPPEESSPAKASPPSRARKRLHSQSDKAAGARVLAVALGVIADEGVAAVTARRIAADASISVGGIYRLFAGIDGLIAACKASVLADLRDALAAAAAKGTGQSVEKRLLRLADAYVAFADARPNAWASLFEHKAEIGSESAHERTKPVFLILEGILADLPGLPKARRPVMARAIWAAVHGIVYLGRGGNLGPVSHENVPAMIRALVGALIAGLGPAAGGA